MSDESSVESEADDPDLDLDDLASRAAEEHVALMQILAKTIEEVVKEPELRNKLKQQEQTIVAAIEAAMLTAREAWSDAARRASRGEMEEPKPNAARPEASPQLEARPDLPSLEMLERMDAELTALSLVDTAIRHFDRAAVTLELADRSRYSSALVLLVAIKRSLLRGHNAYAVRRFIDMAIQGLDTSVEELNTFFRPINEAGPYDPANISEAQRQHLPGLAVAMVMRENHDRIWQEDRLLDAAKVAAEQIADEWLSERLQAIPPSGPLFSRAQWARWMSELVTKALSVSNDHAVQRGANPDPAVRHVAGIVAGLRAAAAVPELRDLVIRYTDPDEHGRRCDIAIVKVREYLNSTGRPDAEAIIRRVLLAFGYEGRKAHSLFESIGIAEKRRATKGT